MLGLIIQLIFRVLNMLSLRLESATLLAMRLVPKPARHRNIPFESPIFITKRSSLRPAHESL